MYVYSQSHAHIHKLVGSVGQRGFAFGSAKKISKIYVHAWALSVQEASKLLNQKIVWAKMKSYFWHVYLVVLGFPGSLSDFNANELFRFFLMVIELYVGRGEVVLKLGKGAGFFWWPPFQTA